MEGNGGVDSKSGSLMEEGGLRRYERRKHGECHV